VYADGIRVDVLLFWEHKDREIEVIVEIARKLKREHDLSVAIASTVYDRFFALLLRPKVVVFHSNKSLPPFYYNLYGPRVRYVCLNWEQMLSEFNKKAAKKADNHLNKEVMINCAWGDQYRDFLIESGVSPENVFVTGRPSLTLLKKKAGDFHRTRMQLAAQFHLDPNRKWLFFPLTCLHAFFSDQLVKGFVKNRLISNQVDEELAFKRRNYVRETVRIIFEWIHDLAEAEGDRLTIILRPHPLISVEQHIGLFRELFGSVPSSVFPTKKLTAQEWLIASDACYTNYSSLALDAYFIRKPSFLMEPRPFPDFLKYEWFKAFPRLKSFQELMDSVDRLDSWSFTQSQIVENQFATHLEGITETSKLIARLAREAIGYSLPFATKLLVGGLKEPRKTFCIRSLSRYVSMRSNTLRKRVPSGRRSDFLSGRQIRSLLREGKILPEAGSRPFTGSH